MTPTRYILDEAADLGYTPKVSWRIQPTRKAYRLAKGAIGVGWLDGLEFEAALFFDPFDEDKALAEMLLRHGVEIICDYDLEDLDA